MERVLKEQGSRDLANAGHVAQGRFAQLPAQAAIASRIDNSPQMIAQRKQLQGMFGGAAQLQEAEEEPLQGKFTAMQRGEGERTALKAGVLPIQFRAMNAGELDGVAKSGELDIFDSRISKGALFTKTVTVNDHTAKSVIPAYRSAIRPIGNTVAAQTYTDYNFANPVPMMAAITPANIITYLMTTLLGGSTVQTTLHVPHQQAMENLFNGKTWPEVKTALGLWHGARENLRANKYVNLIDPFVVRLSFQSKKGGQHDWNIDTQFADSATGYITKVDDGQHDITGSIVTAGDFAAEMANPAAGDEYIYSSTHVAPGGTFGTLAGALAPHAGGDTKGAQHAGFDAVTWMAAEGARFIPVAELGADATPTANFFTKPNKKGWAGAHCVDLNWLMTHWGNPLIFNRAYNITRDAIATVADGLGAPAAITAKPQKPNYNLSNGTMEK